MQKDTLNNVHIADEQVMITPEQLKAQFPLSEQQEMQISESRQVISRIISGEDRRLLVVCGPCSIHDPNFFFGISTRKIASMQHWQSDYHLVLI